MTTTTTTTTETATMSATDTFRIPRSYLPELERRFGRLAKRAEKLGVPAPGFTIVGVEDVPEMRPSLSYEVDGAMEATGRTVQVATLTVHGDAPKYAGWSMIAVIDRDLDEPDSPNVVHVVAGELDPAWRTTGDVCDHCTPPTIARGRKTLVVVEHDTDGRRVVGTTCLHDFLGHTSPTQIAGWIQTLATLGDLFAAFGADDDPFEDRFGVGPRGEVRYDPEFFLATVAAVIREVGWTPKSRATDSHPATAEIARAACDSRDRDRVDVTDADRTAAAEAIAWAAEVDAKNDYLANVQAVAVKSGWRTKDLGIGGSILNAYQRELSFQAERQARDTVTTGPAVELPLGKQTIVGTILSVDRVPGYRPDTTDLKMRVLDDRGFSVYGTVPASLTGHHAKTDRILSWHLEVPELPGTGQSLATPTKEEAELEVERRARMFAARGDARKTYLVVPNYDTVFVPCVAAGDRVQFVATVKASNRPGQGWFSRPTKAERV